MQRNMNLGKKQACFYVEEKIERARDSSDANNVSVVSQQVRESIGVAPDANEPPPSYSPK